METNFYTNIARYGISFIPSNIQLSRIIILKLRLFTYSLVITNKEIDAIWATYEQEVYGDRIVEIIEVESLEKHILNIS